ncbi:GPP34 family phosphoprotein [Micromonospora sp. NPDC005652]|uniref:GOLPH3/VPS74 family protein n=1 Tax=Micromonospora sp. NPDC005652 TaxID=3157046 RepID=UPI0033D2E615
MTTPSGADDRTINMHVEPIGRHHQRPAARMGPPADVLLADEFFLMAHDDTTGQSRLHDVATRFGLAAALLGELGISGHLTFAPGALHIRDARPPADWLQHQALSQIANEPQERATRTWLAFLATTAHENVAQRLIQTGVVAPEERRRLFGLGPATVRYVPHDMNRAAWSWARLSMRLRNSEPLDVFDLTLAGIAEATGLDRFILAGAPYPTSGYLRTLLAAAPPQVAALLSDLHSAVGAASMNPRA